ncbi:MAG: TetR family transcriptional regulator [Rhodobacteraceae bacterium]|nr:MAG: TetR family transcriptional regulator [Paracoccaceae bacterium]
MTKKSSSQSLRTALVEAGISLLNQEGLKGLTLRRTAALAGVSHAAPAHHFDGLAGLQTAIATRAFALFSESMIEHRDAADDEDFTQLLAISTGYLAFAQKHRGLFHLMFNCPKTETPDPDLQREAENSYMILRQGCLPFSGGAADIGLETSVWALVHGYATLDFSTPDAQIKGVPVPPFESQLKRLLSLP